MTFAAKAGDTLLRVMRFLSRMAAVILIFLMAPLILIISLAALVSTGSVFSFTEQAVDGRKCKARQFSASGRVEEYLLRTSFQDLPVLIDGVRGEAFLVCWK